MQDTTNFRMMTPEALAKALKMDYPALKRSMHRMEISCAKDEALTRAALVAIIQQQSEQHHKRPAEVTESARALGTQLGVFSESSDGVGQPSPSAPPSEEPKAKKEDSLHNPPSTLHVQEPRKEEAAAVEVQAASPSWASAAHTAGKTLAVGTLIAFQAFIFASLTMRVFNDANASVHMQFWFAFVAAFLIESAGVMIVSRYKVPEGASEWTKRDIESSINAWLIPFMVFQIAVDCSYIGLFGSWSDIVGQWLVALAIPIGIFAYSHLYFNRN